MKLMNFSSDAISATNNSAFDPSLMRHSQCILPYTLTFSSYVLARLKQFTRIGLNHARREKTAHWQ